MDAGGGFKLTPVFLGPGGVVSTALRQIAMLADHLLQSLSSAEPRDLLLPELLPRATTALAK
jgi:hypothetical protein